MVHILLCIFSAIIRNMQLLSKIKMHKRRKKLAEKPSFISFLNGKEYYFNCTVPAILDNKLIELAKQCGVSGIIERSQIQIMVTAELTDGQFFRKIQYCLEGDHTMYTLENVSAPDDSAIAAVENAAAAIFLALRQSKFDWMPSIIAIQEGSLWPDRINTCAIDIECVLPASADITLIRMAEVLSVDSTVESSGIKVIVNIAEMSPGEFLKQVSIGLDMNGIPVIEAINESINHLDIEDAARDTIFRLNNLVARHAIDWKMPVIELYTRRFDQEKLIRSSEYEFEEICLALDEAVEDILYESQPKAPSHPGDA